MSSPKTNILITIFLVFLSAIFYYWCYYQIFVYKLPVPQGKIDETAAVKIYNHPEIIAKIFRLESSSGRNDSCHKIGKFNGIGWRSNKTCFDTQAQAWDRTDKWLDDHSNLTLAQKICLWNLGKPLNDCNYYRNYLLIK